MTGSGYQILKNQILNFIIPKKSLLNIKNLLTNYMNYLARYFYILFTLMNFNPF